MTMTDTEKTISVLVVDDEERFRTTLLKILKAKGIQAAAAPDGAAALAEIGRCAYDVVLLDVKMPGMDGIEVLRSLRERGCPAEVIILSGHAAVDTAMAIVRHGAFDYLLKPCDIEDLIDKIHAAYDRKAGTVLH
ncbi:MAG: response regulator [Desulfobacterales bacterium]